MKTLGIVGDPKMTAVGERVGEFPLYNGVAVSTGSVRVAEERRISREGGARMNRVNQVLLFLHFLGLALGFSMSFANIVMGSLISKAAPSEKGVLGRFPPAMSRVGRVGLGLLWATGLIMVYTRWNGFAALPWEFHVKLTAVVLLTLTTEYTHRLERRVRTEDAKAAMRIEAFGKVATVFALIALLFAVLAFA